jgi:hypothetical protein
MKEQKRKRELESNKIQPKLSETYTHQNRKIRVGGKATLNHI